ncbi:MAG TPA: hypothetical protein VH481_01200 [Nitrososphaeraceae archaeon]
MNEYNTFNSYIYGQTSATNSLGLIYESKNSSFNAEGTINTILFSQDTTNNTIPSAIDINTNHSSKYLLGGKWRMDVLNNNVTYFKSNFTMIDINGDNIHFHTIVYKPSSTHPIVHGQSEQGILFKNKSNYTSGFNCDVDIYTNGVLEWEDVPIKVSLINEKIIMMEIKDKKPEEHFLKNPIYGLINSVDLITK